MKKTIKILSAILSVIMMLAVVPFSTVAATTDVEEWEDGTLLMKKDVLFNTSVEEKVEGLEVSEIAATATNVTKATDGGSFTANTSIKAVLTPLSGISTNLKLDENSKYTIEMTMNFADSGRAVIGFDGDDMSMMHGIYFNKTSLRTNYSLTSAVTNTLDKYTISKTSFTSTNDKNDHLLRFEINGNVISVYIDGTKYGTIDFGESTASTTAPAGLNSPLSIAITALPSNSIDANKTIIQVKDVSIYAGNVAGPKVSYEDENGNSLGVLPVEIGDVITEIPEVAAHEGKVVKWFHKGTNIIVSTPYTVPTASVVLVAKVIDTSEIKVAGMQYTAVSNSNTQSIRFVATIHTLQAEETGFVVTAKYMESGILKEKEFKVSSKTVYTAITANESGTVKSVTAGELGGTYLVAISVDDVPTNIGQIDFYVTALLKISDTRTVESAQVSFSMKDGAVLKNATPLT